MLVTGGDGAEVIYALRNDSNLADLILEKMQKAGQNVRDSYQRRLPNDTSKDYYFIHRETGAKTMPVIVEYGFLDSTLDDPEQLKNNYENYASAVVGAILEYIIKAEIFTYVVKKGDTLYSIAKEYDTTVDNLIKLNNLATTSLSVGQKLKVPKEKFVEEEGTYIVEKGDSLYKIAQKFGTTVNNLIKLNNLKSTDLSIGQKLIVPQIVEQLQQLYVVVAGDSLYKIAQKFNTTVDEIVKLNNLTSTNLSIGQKLKLPVKETTEEIIFEYYTVQSGDNLYNIANRYNTTVAKLMELNGLTSTNLSIGQKLKVPVIESPTPSQKTYIVQSGDSLWSIAKKFDTTVAEIKEKNKLNSNSLSIGQKLIV